MEEALRVASLGKERAQGVGKGVRGQTQAEVLEW